MLSVAYCQYFQRRDSTSSPSTAVTQPIIFRLDQPSQYQRQCSRQISVSLLYIIWSGYALLGVSSSPSFYTRACRRHRRHRVTNNTTDNPLLLHLHFRRRSDLIWILEKLVLGILSSWPGGVCRLLLNKEREGCGKG